MYAMEKVTNYTLKTVHKIRGEGFVAQKCAVLLFLLDNLQEMGVTSVIAERGHNYYMENRVRYLCLEDSIG